MSSDPRVQFGREAAKYLTSGVHADPTALESLVALAAPSGGCALDVGTGAGHMAFALAPHVELVVALDPTFEMLRVVRDEASVRGLANVRPTLGWAEDLPLRPGCVSLVSCRMAGHHFRDPARFVAEASRVLASRGSFLLVDTVAPDDPEADALLNAFEARRDPSHQRDLTLRAWTSLTESAGLDVETTAVRRKRIPAQDWMDRMSVASEVQAELWRSLRESAGAFRDYLSPDETSFDLHEAALLARKP